MTQVAGSIELSWERLVGRQETPIGPLQAPEMAAAGRSIVCHDSSSRPRVTWLFRPPNDADDARASVCTRSREPWPFCFCLMCTRLTSDRSMSGAVLAERIW